MMVDRRTVHCGGFMGLLLGKTLPDVFLKRTCYPTFSHWARGYLMELAHPAHTEFVICDYAIENRLHWVLDVTFQEDASRVRDQHARHNLALLRKIACNLIQHSTTAGSIRGRRKQAAWNNDFVAQLLR
ncbi:MAG TPA: hypothetical protein VKT82_01615 [Ktedonobacterales bacterium]|nr:hypothetical protein [Ktedonobacterales bacterium]